MIRPNLRHASWIGNGDERGQILVLRAEPVENPRAQAGAAGKGRAGIELQATGRMRGGARVHGAEHAMRHVGQLSVTARIVRSGTP